MKKVVVFGTGNYCSLFFKSEYEEAFDIVALVDNDKKKWGSIAFGLSIISPDSMPPVDIVVIAIKDKEVIADQLLEIGVDINNIYVFNGDNGELYKYFMDNEYRLFLKEAEDQICFSLLNSALKKGEFEGIKRVIIMGEDEHLLKVASFFKSIGKRVSIELFESNTVYDRYDKLVLTGEDYKENVRLIRDKKILNASQWIILPFYDVRDSII